MKTFTEFNKNIDELFGFKKKSPEEKKAEQLKDTLRKLANKSAGRGGWSEGEQESYNKAWIEYRKLTGHSPKGPKPGVFFDRLGGMSIYKHDELTKALHKKLGIK